MKKRDVLKTGIMVMLLCTTSIFTFAVNNKASASDSEDNIDACLKAYGLTRDSTVGEFKHILDNSMRKMWNLFIIIKMKKELTNLYNIFGEMGIKDGMTIREMLVIIENNPEPLQDLGINILCSIDVEGLGSTRPYIRLFKAAFGFWQIIYTGTSPPPHAEIVSSFVGRQYCEDVLCSGVIWGLVGCLVTGIAFPGDELPVCATATVMGFALWSRSNVPFVS